MKKVKQMFLGIMVAGLSILWALPSFAQTRQLMTVPNQVPEPGTLILLGCALAGLAGLRTKFKK